MPMIRFQAFPRHADVFLRDVLCDVSSRSRTASMASDMFQLGRVRPLDETTAAIEKVTAKSIQKYFDAVPPRDFTVVTLGPQELSL